MTKVGIRSVIALGIAISILMSLPFAEAQETAVAPAASLQAQLDKLEQGQEKIVKEIASLIQLLQGALTAVPSNPQLPPPSALIVENQTFRGNNGATVAIVEYADFECPYCGEYEHGIYPQIAKDYIDTGKVKYFYRDLPLQSHPHAMIAAHAARCAGEQGKYWEMHDSLFAKQNALRDVDMPDRAQELGLDKTKFAECLASDRHNDEINKSVAEAQKMGIAGTPTFLVGKLDPNGEVSNLKMIVGARSYDIFKSAIDDTLAAK